MRPLSSNPVFQRSFGLLLIRLAQTTLRGNSLLLGATRLLLTAALLSAYAGYPVSAAVPSPEESQEGVDLSAPSRSGDEARLSSHWAYIPPKTPLVPTVKNPVWIRNPIDTFIAARLDQEGMNPAPEASKATLIRRATLDLTGLPPTLAELEAFLADQAPDAYDRLVERLLASAHYGERMAVWWLDLGRYADTHGYEGDGARSIWPYRDWVINALNSDLPFDQFTIEQLAGDLLPEASRDQRVATGFHRNTLINGESGIDIEQFRVEAVVDRVNTTMTVWMGTTMGCAQCHAHKYDPFTQEEYYQLFAFFNTSATEVVANPSPDGPGRSFIGPHLELWDPGEEAERKALDARIEQLKKRSAKKAKETKEQEIPSNAQSAVAEKIKAELAELEKAAAQLQPVKTLVMMEREEPRETRVLQRGDFLSPGDVVRPGVPAVWHSWPEAAPRNRLGLAQWLVHPGNPLLARVTMNRVWAQHFGRGLVATGEEFGSQGARPTHPQLLDFLATEFVRQGWSLKAMHRLIVTSAAYRQESRMTPRLRERDPYNSLYARGPSLRLEAETLRDNALAISGLLNPRGGGPPVYPVQVAGVYEQTHGSMDWKTSEGGDQFRRSIYTYWRRTAPYPMLMTFDGSNRSVCIEKRSRTNTPLQALATLNDPGFIQCSVALGRRLWEQKSGPPAQRARHGLRLALLREPAAEEVNRLVALYQENLLTYEQDPEAARKWIRAGAAKPPSDPVALVELAAWSVVGNVLLNLDETISRY